MSAVIRGIACVIGAVPACQSFSASESAPKSARSRKIPAQDEHFATAAPPISRLAIGPWHLGQVISSMSPKVLPRHCVT